jgi:CheY-like chemotaxis protein
MQMPFEDLGRHLKIFLKVKTNYMKTPTILIIDDEAFIREKVQKILEKEGYFAESASDIRTAIDKLAAKDYDLILCDVMIPAIGGFELIEQIKSDPTKKHIPIIMVTGMERDILQMTRHEADDVLTKPFKSEDLLTKVKQFLPDNQQSSTHE